jgi:VWFA-related protein
VYVSNGYNFNPFSDARLQKVKDSYADAEYFTGGFDPGDEESLTGFKERESLREGEYNKRTQFSFAELTNELAQVERAAQRANVTFYPIDPRGMIPYSDARSSTNVKYDDWRDHFQTQINSLQALAEGTGGFCVCGTNDIAGALRRIDAETSDFYRIGYTSNNSDPTQIRRRIRIEVDRPGVEPLVYRSEYTLPRTPNP